MKKKTVQKFQHRKPDNSLKNPWLFAGVLLPITFIVFSPALFNEFVNWDDYNYIRDNPLLQDFSLNTIRHLFNFGTFVMGNYHPFTMLSYLAEYHFAGSSPFLYHFDNIILHLFNVALISVLIWKLTGKYYATLIAAALFALHPMRVESVVWAAERKDVLYAFFYLVSIIAYTYYIRSSEKRYVYYTVSLLVFLFSLLSKGQAVVLPLTFFLVDYWYGKKIDFKSVASKIPFLALSVFFGILAINAQSSSLTSQRLISYTFGERIVFAAYNLVAYLYKLIYPYDLACYYGYPDESGMKLIYAGALLAVGIMAFVFLRFRKNKAVMFGTLFFLATIFIVIQLLPVGNAIIADRYTYIPYIGLFFIIALLLDPLLSTGSLKRRRIAGALIGLQLLVFAVASFSQAKTWKNNETLWLRAIDNEPEQGMPYNNLGIYLMEQKKYDTAILLLNRSIASKRPYTERFRPYQNLGKAYSETSRPAKALECYNTSIKLAPGFQEPLFGKGLVFTDLGQYDSAIAVFTRILVIMQPDHAESFYSRAIAYNKKQLPDSAIADYTRAIAVKPDYSGAYTNRGNINFTKDRFDQAIEDYNQALKYDPSDAKTYLNRSFAWFRRGNLKEALNDAETAKSMNIDVNPNYLLDLKNRLAASK